MFNAKLLKKTNREKNIPYTKAGGSAELPGDQRYTAMVIQGTDPVITPNQYDTQDGLPGCSYFSMTRPNKIIEALTPNKAINAEISVIPGSIAIITIINEELKEYSIHLA
jgi:hypothetical protein